MKTTLSFSTSSSSGLSVSKSAIFLLATFLMYRAFQVFTGLDGALRDEMLSAHTQSELLMVPSKDQITTERRRQEAQQRNTSHNIVSSSTTTSTTWVYHGKSAAALPSSSVASSSSSAFSSGTDHVAAPSGMKGNPKPPEIGKNVTTPYFILHIGPPKTATTSIQCGLTQFSRRLANRDNYYFLGSACRVGKVRNMPNGESSILTYEMVSNLNRLNVTYIKGLQIRIQQHRRMGHHLIISSEHFTSKMKDGIRVWNVLKQLTAGFQVKVVIAYRHYFQWIASMYYQQHHSPQYRRWPHLGGKTHPTFQSFLAAHLDDWEASGRNNITGAAGRNAMHHSLWALLTWAGHFDDVHVFDLHQDGDAFTNFVCQALPSANHSCHALTQLVERGGGDVDTVVKRVSSDYHAERVVEEAYLRGLIRRDVGKNDTLGRARETIGRHGIHKNAEYMECIPTALEGRLRNASLTFMELLYEADGRHLSDLELEEAVSEHDSMFEESKDQGRYCDIHPTRFLENSTLFQDAFDPTHRIEGQVNDPAPNNDS